MVPTGFTDEGIAVVYTIADYDEYDEQDLIYAPV